MRDRLVTVFGGSGFLGRHLVRRLAARGARITVAVRDPVAAAFLKPMGDVGQITPVAANIREPGSVDRAVAGADAVVNLVGILYESGPQRFGAVQARGAATVAAAARAAGARRLVQVSAIGADPQSPSLYAQSKAAGEAAAAQAFSGATIVRPAIVVGPEDGFFNRFGALARVLPVLPLIGGGLTRMQPVFVGDVAEAMTRILADPATAGETYELGGPRVYTFKELLELVLRETDRKRLLVPLPFAVAKFEAVFLQLLPKPLLTVDQVRLLERDTVVAPDAKGFAALGITPQPIGPIAAEVVARYRRPGARAVAAS